ncbi:ciliary microtubule-associated protein 3-like isoform X2 [Ruditapes philippinarum]|uniref:ciliary microtubule-associated protein 3-like isoform X2 n=1 Tax=Ruditapes philippinarum TaxID=129788 RepID=UPI00295A69F8|nr:ciliary microtubule-associated protein 3-like isoform X2 [Ruditapes philippinarum]
MAMEVEKGPKVSFMTTLDRELFPVKMPQNRFGNEICPLRGAPHRGPGCYENEEKTNFWYEIEHKINSSKGYTLGARTGPRLPKDNIGTFFKSNTNPELRDSDMKLNVLQRANTTIGFQTPSPTTYQTKCTDLMEFDRSKKPFLVGADRFPVYRRDINEVLPGPGVYEHDIRRNRRVQWHQSFGGTPIAMPTIQVRSIIDQNTEKLYSTKEEKKYNRKLAYMKLYYE